MGCCAESALLPPFGVVVNNRAISGTMVERHVQKRLFAVVLLQLHFGYQ